MSAEDVYMLMLGARRLSEVSLPPFKAALMRRLQASFSECFCDGGFRLTHLSNARLTTLNRLTSEVTSPHDHECRAGTPQRFMSATKGWYSESGLHIPLLIWLSSLHHSSSTFLSHPFVWIFLSEPPCLSPLCLASSFPLWPPTTPPPVAAKTKPALGFSLWGGH